MVEHGTVGLVGLGEIGLPMASRLVQAGWRVVGYDVQRKALEQAVAAGVQRAGSPAEVARAVDRTIVSVVRTLPQTEAVLFGADGLVSANRPTLDVAVMSTLNPAAMAKLAERAAGHGLTLVDAPVSGGRAGAEAGTLAIMLAASRRRSSGCGRSSNFWARTASCWASGLEWAKRRNSLPRSCSQPRCSVWPRG